MVCHADRNRITQNNCRANVNFHLDGLFEERRFLFFGQESLKESIAKEINVIAKPRIDLRGCGAALLHEAQLDHPGLVTL